MRGRRIRTVLLCGAALLAIAIPALAAAGDPPSCAPVGEQSAVHGQSSTFTVTCTPQDETATSVSYAVDSQPAAGEGDVFADGAGGFTYTAPLAFVGPTSFTYIAMDDAGNTTTAQHVTLRSTNARPTCSDVNLGNVAHGASVTGASNCADTDAADAFSYSIPAGEEPAHGSADVGFDGTISYSADPSYSGVDSFKMVANDGAQDSLPATITVTVDNQSPTCNDVDLGSVLHGGTTFGGVDCSDPDFDALTFAAAGAGATKGTATIDPNGSITYQANAAATGTDTFHYQATDAIGAKSPIKQVTVDITNRTPVCNAPFAEITHWNTAVDISHRCSDPDFGDALTFTITDQPDHGTLSAFNSITQTWRYTPNDKYVGADSFSYTVSDGVATTAAAKQDIEVTNSAPTCASNSLEIRTGKLATLTLSCNEFDFQDTLTVSLVGTPARGTVTNLKVDQFRQVTADFTPEAGYTGPASFQVKASDGQATSATATITLAVTVNHKPSCSFLTTAATKVATPYEFTLSCFDEDYQDQDSLTYAKQANPSHGTLGTITRAAGQGKLTYTPNTGYTGRDQFTFRASDGELFVDAVQAIHVADTPFCTPAPTIQVRPDRQKSSSMDCTNVPGSFSGLTYSIQQQPAKGTLTGTSQFGSFASYRANANAAGADSYVLRVSNGSTFSEATQQINVSPDANEPPVCSDSFSPRVVYAGRTAILQAFTFPCNDPDFDPLTFTKAANAGHGTIVPSGSGLAYTGDVGYTGPDSFTYTATDSLGATTAPARQDLDVRPPEKPTCNAVPAVNVRPSTTRATKTISVFCTNPQGDQQTYSADTTGTVGTVTQALGSTSNQFSYTAGSAQGTDSFKVIAHNQVGDSAPVTVNVTISTTANELPVCGPTFTPQKVSKTGDTPLLLANRCSDADGDALEFTVVANTTHGGVIPATGKSASPAYHGNGTYLGLDSFTYKASDGRGESTVTSYSIEVIESVAPSCTPKPTLQIRPNRTKSLGFTCVDPNGLALTYKVVSAPTAGTLSPPGDTTSPLRSYTAPGTEGPASFTYKVTNSAGADSAVYTQNIQVSTTANDVPTCTANSFIPQTIAKDRTNVTLNTAQFCSDPDGDPMTYELAPVRVAAQHGTVIAEGGVLKYTPTTGYTGPDSVDYVARDSQNGTSTTTRFHMNVIEPPSPECSATGPRSVRPSKEITIFFPCSDPVGDALTYKIGTAPTKGTLTPAGDSPFPARTYKAGAVEGQDSFTFLASAGTRSATPVTQAITISADANSAPFCASNEFNPKTVFKNQATAIDPGCGDQEGDPVTYAKVSEPSHGTLAITPVRAASNRFTYTPSADYVGTDSFSYKATDDRGLASAVVTYSISVTEPTGPVCSTQPLLETRPGRSVFAATPCGDAGGATVTVEIVSAPAHGTLSPAGDSTQQVRSYTPAAGYSGPDSFTYRGRSANGTGQTVTRNISVTSTANTLPGCSAGQTLTAATATATTFTPSCFDFDGDAIDYLIVTGPAHGTLTPTTSRASGFSYTSASGYTGPDSFTLSAGDGRGTTNMTVSVTVAAQPNRAPSCAPLVAQNAVAGEALTISGTCTDPDGDTISVVPGTSPAKGALGLPSVNGSDVSVVYTANAGATGADSFTFRVSDGSLQSPLYTVSITINGRPACASIPDVAVKNHTATPVQLSCSDPDSGPSPLNYTVVTPPQHGTLGAISATGLVTYTPTGNYDGADSFSVKVSDTRTDSTPRTVGLTVAANQKPGCAAVAALSVPHNGSATTGAVSCTDAESDATTLQVGTAPQHGTVTIDQGTRKATYSPTTGYSGADSFTIVGNDGHGGLSDPVSVGVTVAANVLPACEAQAVSVVNHTAKPITVRCTDADGQALTLSTVAAPQHGTLTPVRAASTVQKSFTYTPTGNYAGPDTFAFKANDGEADSAAATVSLTVAANAVPVCQEASADVAHNTAKDVTLTCTDAEGDTLSHAVVAAPAHGTATIAGGKATYTPTTAYGGPDSFTYKASDGHGGESTAAKVSLTVASAPVATPTPTPTVSATPTPAPTTTPPPDDSAAKAQQRLTALAAKLGKAAVASAGKLDAKKATLALGTVGAADCPAGCTITLGLAKGAKKIGTATLTVSPGGTAAVKLKLNAAGKKLLKKGKPVKATLTMTLRDTATGTTKTVTQPITLKPKKKK